MLRRLVFASMLVVAGSGPARAAASPPSLLLITLDTTRADRLGSYGYAAAVTPNLDRLAAGGALFEDALTSCPLTLPAHATLLTGRQPRELSVRINGRDVVSRDVTTLAEVLQERGWLTAAFVAAFVLDERFGLAQGFTTYDDEVKRDQAGSKVEPLTESRPANEVTDAALAWLRRVAFPSSRPFFAWVHFYDAHRPYTAHPELAGTRVGGPASYDQEIAFVDLQVGRLLAALDAHDRRDRTLVVVVGDHGEGLGEHGEQEHGYLLNREALRVPLILSWPGHVPKTRVATLTSMVDVMPTILDLLGVDARPTTSGRSLAPALGGATLEALPSYAETDLPYAYFGWSPLRSLTTDRWHYVHTADPELYDRRADSGEHRNLAGAERAVAAELATQLGTLGKSLRPVAAGETATLDPKDRKRLEALGYLMPGPTRGAVNGDDVDVTTRKDMKRMVTVKQRAGALRRALQDGRLTDAQAVPLARELVAASPETHAFHYTLGRSLLRTGQLADARGEFEEALRLRPDLPEIHSDLATTLLRQGAFGEARTHFETALRLQPEIPEAQLGLGTIAARAGAYEEAIGRYRAALAITPDYADAHMNLANALSRTGERELALAEYRKTIELDPTQGLAYYNMGIMLADTGTDDQEAAAALRRAVELRPRMAHAYFTLGCTLAELGELESAITAHRRAVELRPRNLLFVDNLAASYAAAGRFDEAVATAKQGVLRARAAGQTERAHEIKRRIHLYRRMQREVA